jgi:hypothetical protein
VTGRAPLLFWVVYDSPKDAPGLWLVRPQQGEWPPTPEPYAYTFRSLDQAHRFCARMGLFYMPRHPMDDPVIVGCWF